MKKFIISFTEDENGIQPEPIWWEFSSLEAAIVEACARIDSTPGWAGCVKIFLNHFHWLDDDLNAQEWVEVDTIPAAEFYPNQKKCTPIKKTLDSAAELWQNRRR